MRADEPVLMMPPGISPRLLYRVARAYHEQGMKQAEIAQAFHISQPRVSRLLKAAVDAGVVRTTVVMPTGLHTSLEERLEEVYGLKRVLIVDSDGDVTRSLGAAAASYLSNTLLGSDTLGLHSWSNSVIATANAMSSFRIPVADRVVQLVGGVGSPTVQLQDMRLLSRLADCLGATPLLLPSPGVLGSAEARHALASDPAVAEVIDCWNDLTIAVSGIGPLGPQDLAREYGHIFGDDAFSMPSADEVVGDLCLRFFDERGALVPTAFDERLIGIAPEQLLRVERRIGVAGGLRKAEAIRGAILGDWINVLITDQLTAEHLLVLAAAP